MQILSSQTTVPTTTNMEKTRLLLQQQPNKPQKATQTKNQTLNNNQKKTHVHTKQSNNNQKENSSK
jgi:hypothetical protein